MASEAEQLPNLNKVCVSIANEETAILETIPPTSADVGTIAKEVTESSPHAIANVEQFTTEELAYRRFCCRLFVISLGVVAFICLVSLSLRLNDARDDIQALQTLQVSLNKLLKHYKEQYPDFECRKYIFKPDWTDTSIFHPETTERELARQLLGQVVYIFNYNDRTEEVEIQLTMPSTIGNSRGRIIGAGRLLMSQSMQYDAAHISNFGSYEGGIYKHNKIEVYNKNLDGEWYARVSARE